MTRITLDITGKVCPYCLLAVQKKATTLKPSDELIITCDHPPAATTSIPQLAADLGLVVDTRKVASGLWEIRLSKNK